MSFNFLKVCPRIKILKFKYEHKIGLKSHYFLIYTVNIRLYAKSVLPQIGIFYCPVHMIFTLLEIFCFV